MVIVAVIAAVTVAVAVSTICLLLAVCGLPEMITSTAHICFPGCFLEYYRACVVVLGAIRAYSSKLPDLQIIASCDIAPPSKGRIPSDEHCASPQTRKGAACQQTTSLAQLSCGAGMSAFASIVLELPRLGFFCRSECSCVNRWWLGMVGSDW